MRERLAEQGFSPPQADRKRPRRTSGLRPRTNPTFMIPLLRSASGSFDDNTPMIPAPKAVGRISSTAIFPHLDWGLSIRR